MLKRDDICSFLSDCIDIGRLVQKFPLVDNMLVPLIPTRIVDHLIPVYLIHLLQLLKLVQLLLELLEPLVRLVLHR